MKLQDNVLKAYLKNVLFISGTPCGGKTTISRKLAEKYGLPVYDIDQEFGRHRFLSSPDVQPCMNKSFADADAFSVGRWRTHCAGWSSILVWPPVPSPFTR